MSDENELQKKLNEAIVQSAILKERMDFFEWAHAQEGVTAATVARQYLYYCERNGK